MTIDLIANTANFIMMKISQVAFIFLLIISVNVDVQAQSDTAATTQQNTHLLFPTGRLAVGTTVFHWTDSSRHEVLNEEFRKVAVQLWYPTRDTLDSQRAPYREGLEYLESVLNQKTIELYKAVKTNSWLNAPLSNVEDSYPIIIFSHGLGMSRAEYSSLAEELASKGFIVAGIDHPYGADAVVLPDGRVIKQDPQWNVITPPEYSIKERFRFTDERTEIWAADARFVLNRLEKLNRDGRFAGTLNLEQIGIFGHSVGGKAAVVACMLDDRFDACLNLDGWPIHSFVEVNGLNQPFMFIEDIRDVTEEELEAWGASIEEYARNMRDLQLRKERLLEAMESNSYHVKIRGIRHLYFSDIPYINRDAIHPDAALEPRVALQIIRKYMVVFFMEQLYKKDTELLHPQSTIRIYGSEQYLNKQ